MKFRVIQSDFFQIPFPKKCLIACFHFNVFLPVFTFAADVDVKQSRSAECQGIYQTGRKTETKRRIFRSRKTFAPRASAYPQNKDVKLDLAYLLLKQRHILTLTILPSKLPKLILKIRLRLPFWE